MGALAASGVKSDDQLVGAINLKADKIVCFSPVIPNPAAECEIQIGAAVTKTPPSAAKTIYSILEAHGARVSNPPGVVKVEAGRIACSKPVVPNPQAKCEFYRKN